MEAKTTVNDISAIDHIGKNTISLSGIKRVIAYNLV
jgi:hypothetical protein